MRQDMYTARADNGLLCPDKGISYINGAKVMDGSVPDGASRPILCTLPGTNDR